MRIARVNEKSSLVNQGISCTSAKVEVRRYNDIAKLKRYPGSTTRMHPVCKVRSSKLQIFRPDASKRWKRAGVKLKPVFSPRSTLSFLLFAELKTTSDGREKKSLIKKMNRVEGKKGKNNLLLSDDKINFDNKWKIFLFNSRITRLTISYQKKVV